ncbi:hypothetical protein [Gracilimonas tropica]|uniref:hypothetical protein n=1 Tax=Gracilimonas tropica TaxID=454600 RepID=UPI0003711C10|nr:hypothetical protein [Gracilimonas tropica]
MQAPPTLVVNEEDKRKAIEYRPLNAGTSNINPPSSDEWEGNLLNPSTGSV